MGVDKKKAKQTANWLINDYFGIQKKAKIPKEKFPILPIVVAFLLEYLDQNFLSKQQVNNIVKELLIPSKQGLLLELERKLEKQMNSSI